MEILIYSAKVGLYWGLFYLSYQLLLRKYTFFVWNRCYLLGTLFASLFLPFVTYPEAAPDVPVIYQATLQIANIEYQPQAVPESLSISELIWIVYGSGALFAVFLFAKKIREIFTFIQNGEIVELDRCTLVLMDHDRIGSFSFLKWLVISKSDYAFDLDTILRHETTHIEQRHSIDILLIELLKIIFWFNPILFFYKNALQEIHEFLADETAENREQYAHFLLKYALSVQSGSLSSHFFKTSQIRNRILMIYKNRSPKWVKSSYLLVLTFIGTIAMAVAGYEKVRESLKLKFVSNVTTEVAGDIIIEGWVTDAETKRALPGATVVIKGTTRGATTDHDGRFLIKGPADSELAITYLGFNPQIRQVRGVPNQMIALEREEITKKTTSERTVPALPDKKDKPELTAAQSQISTKTTLAKVRVSELESPGVGELEQRPALLTLHERAAQNPESSAPAKVFTVVENQPQFPGGIKAMYKFLENNIRYPDAAKDANITGRVFLSFVVSDQGEIGSILILKGLGYGCDQEAVRVVSSFPKWEPGRQNNVPVSVRYNLPINFQMIGIRTTEDTRTGRLARPTSVQRVANRNTSSDFATLQDPPLARVSVKASHDIN